MIMPFEGTHYEALEDVTTIIALEPTHTPEDEDYYRDMILSGIHDEAESEQMDAHREFFYGSPDWV